MSRIKICAAEEQIRKNVSGAQAEFIRHCRIRNLSLRTIDYYQEDIEYFLKWSNLKFVDDITKDVMDNFVAHEMDKGNKVTAINSRIRGLRVFFRFCVDKEYMDGFKYPLLKVDQEQKEQALALQKKHEEEKAQSIINNYGNLVYGDVSNSTLSVDNSVQKIKQLIDENGGDDKEVLHDLLEEVKELISNIEASRTIPKQKRLFQGLLQNPAPHRCLRCCRQGLLRFSPSDLLPAFRSP